MITRPTTLKDVQEALQRLQIHVEEAGYPDPFTRINLYRDGSGGVYISPHYSTRWIDVELAGFSTLFDILPAIEKALKLSNSEIKARVHQADQDDREKMYYESQGR